jgi:hypothetical protein
LHQHDRPHNPDEKQTGERSAGNPHATFDAAGAETQLTIRLVRHSQRKRGATDRSDLRSMASALDPTCERPVVKFRRPTHPGYISFEEILTKRSEFLN